MWFLFAILSALFAAFTSILAKIGIEGVNSNLATAIRTVVVVIMSWGMVFLTNAQSGIPEISKKKLDFFGSFRTRNRGIMALLLPGIADRGGFQGGSG